MRIELDTGSSEGGTPQAKSRGSRSAWLLAVGTALLGLLVWQLLQPKGAARFPIEARKILMAIANDDPDFIYRHFHEMEVRETGLTKEKWRRIWTELIKPRYEGHTFTGEVELEPMSPWQLTGNIHMRDSKGRAYVRDIVVSWDDDKALVTAHTIISGSHYDNYRGKHGTWPLDMRHGIGQKYLKEDVAYLEGLGITRLMSVSQDGMKTFSYRAMLDRVTARAQDERRKKNKP